MAPGIQTVEELKRVLIQYTVSASQCEISIETTCVSHRQGLVFELMQQNPVLLEKMLHQISHTSCETSNQGLPNKISTIKVYVPII